MDQLISLIGTGGVHLFTFVHCADLHLDSPLHGLSGRADAPIDQLRSATRRALENLVDFCVRESVHFVVIAGDVYDGDWKDYHTGLFFRKCMARLGEAGIPVFFIRGNHDAASIITRELRLPDNVFEFSVLEPETHYLEDIGVAIHGQGFAKRDVRENLAISYPDPVPGYFNIGLLHTAVQGQAGHDTYAPCRIDDLRHKGYDYWALGHIHMRQILHEYPHIVYPGNLQGRHIRETGAKGCTVVRVDGGRVVDLRQQPLDVLRWEVCEIAIDGVTDLHEVVDRTASSLAKLTHAHQGYPLAVRAVLTGETEIHGALLGDEDRVYAEVIGIAQDIGSHIWIEQVRIDTRPVATAEQRLDQATSDWLVSALQAARGDVHLLDQFVRDMQSTQDRHGYFDHGADTSYIRSRDDVLRLLDEAEAMLYAQLARGSDQR
ncbi:metallophosphoesterase [Alicyclobacillus hesperidum]|uniref:DNA repair exonuclease SbcCD nuclease subunit n=1 Tax=Alicyclobacillus hesperidum TaxID=89784 RepID=A0A1H2TUB0_9BACL|nr:DNA repair exonuclease [Alicyclobacillus hesperidum]GLV14006.1 metallophosphoesterase [Alicyclobacillus hesperidum]SDW47308.1 DNA repair exonuclease SbcCD nuclease subunit [Alicyclobacillus hesperidum]